MRSVTLVLLIARLERGVKYSCALFSSLPIASAERISVEFAYSGKSAQSLSLVYQSRYTSSRSVSDFASSFNRYILSMPRRRLTRPYAENVYVKYRCHSSSHQCTHSHTHTFLHFHPLAFAKRYRRYRLECYVWTRFAIMRASCIVMSLRYLNYSRDHTAFTYGFIYRRISPRNHFLLQSCPAFLVN